MMRRIVFIASNEWVPWGGSELCWSLAAERLIERGVQVYVSVNSWGERVKQVEHLRSLGCQIFYRPQPSLPERIRRRIFLRKGYASHHVRRIGTGADLIVISQGGNQDGLPWMEAARSCAFRYATIVQSVAEHWWPGDELAKRFADVYEGALSTFFVSEANLALTRRQFGTALPRGRVIRNPFSVRYTAQPAWPGGPEGQLSLACVGRLEVHQKGQDLLMRVLGLRHWRARNVRLTLAGTGMNERSLRHMADTLKLTNVNFAGFVDDVEKLWSSHHTLVLPSRYEGMPLALVEAMLCGRPGIVTDVAGHRELVRDNVNGFLAKAATVELLDEAMNRAWENRHRLQEMGEVAARDVRQWVSSDPTGDFVRELDSLVNGASS
jgi:glycosyltransferase involved in cell wall biosynthesis